MVRVGRSIQSAALRTHSKTLRDPHAWQPLTNITLGPIPAVVQRPFDATNRFYPGAWVP